MRKQCQQQSYKEEIKNVEKCWCDFGSFRAMRAPGNTHKLLKNGQQMHNMRIQTGIKPHRRLFKTKNFLRRILQNKNSPLDAKSFASDANDQNIVDSFPAHKMSKRDVLKAFKTLHRITQKTFEGDKRAIIEARQRINLEFRKEIDSKEIGEDNPLIIQCSSSISLFNPS